MISITCIYVGGVLSLLLAFFHTRFYKTFRWQTEFEKLSIVNARIFYTIHIALLLLLFILGVLSIGYAREMSQSEGLAGGLNGLLAAFWLWRLVWQIAYFKRRKGLKIPPISIVLSVAFALLFASYFIPLVCRFLP